MGRHASANRRRGLAAWPVIVGVAVLLVAALTVTYFLIVNRQRSTAGDCTGSTVLPVLAGPGAAQAINDAATAFNKTKPVARSTCVSVSVSSMPGSTAVTAIGAGWKNQTSPGPGLWVADSAADLDALDAADPALTAGHTNVSLATSPVVLAVRAAPAAAISWAGLAAAGTPLVLSVPDPAANRASSYALESMLAAGSKTAAGQPIDSAAGADSILAPAAAALAPAAPSTTAAALTDLAAGSGGFTAVPVVESDLAVFNRNHPTGLTAVYPTGAAAGDELLAIPLTADWVTDAMSDAAAAFDAYLTSGPGVATLAAAALRTAGSRATVPGIDLTTKITTLPDASLAVRARLSQAWSGLVTKSGAPGTTSTPATSTPATSTTAVPSTAGTAPAPTTRSSTPAPTPTSSAPVTTTARSTPPRTTTAAHSTTATTAAPVGPALTLVLDTSGSMDTTEANLQRIMWMQAAVNADVQKNPTGQFGLWTFSTDDGSSGYTKVVGIGPLTETVGADTRAATITTAVNSLTPGGDSWTYAAIQAAYSDAVAGAVAGRPNRMIVITDGADTTPSLSRATLLGNIAALAGQNKGVALDIIGLSGDVNGDAMTAIAQAGGGTYTPLNTLADLQPTLLALSAS